MTDFRVVTGSGFDIKNALAAFTIQKSDESFEGTWSKPSVPLLIFSDNALEGTLGFQGGALAGAPGGHPLQLIFWGSWWNTQAGRDRSALIETRTQALLASRYFDELAQYGVPHAPLYRGSVVVTKPAAPSSASSPELLMQKVLKLVDELIDDNVFPDPDDGPRFIFIVLLPVGFTVSGALGAHWKDYDNDFPWLDADHYWAGWVRPLPVDPTVSARDASAMKTLSHEVCEMLTDPEGDGWCTKSSQNNEISDAGVSPGAVQTAFVNGVHVQSYWSARHGATVIPIDMDYAARLRGHVKETSRRTLDWGTFRPEPADSANCAQFKACCIKDKDYVWRVYGVEELAQVRLQTTRYRSPVASWTIEGKPVSGAGTLTVGVDVETYVGRKAKTAKAPVTLSYSTTLAGIDIWAPNSGGNFQLHIGCAVRDGSITGNVATDVIATPEIVIGMVGVELLLEDDYIKQRSACLTAMLRKYLVQYRPTGKIHRDEGINWDLSALFLTQPAYVRPSQYRRIKWLQQAARAAHFVLGAKAGRELAGTLAGEARALSQSENLGGSVRRTRAMHGRARVLSNSAGSEASS